ncbi:MAG: lipopolysaccharide heptosyltransferase II [Candidatus Omnitrophica bacterium]|nr:lipopolysaccharide heptosyltransferase II [Candidatus Omnitrophota bacterium]
MPDNKINKKDIKKILVFRTDRIGDVLLSIPAIRALYQSFQHPSISVITQSSYACLLEGNPEIDRIISYDKKNDGFEQTLRLIKNLKKEEFNLAVVLNPKKRSNIIAFLAGIPYRLGYQQKWGFLLNYRIKDEKYKGEKHEVDYNLDLVRTIGADTNDKSFSIKTNQEEDTVDFLLKNSKIKDNDSLIAIHPGSSCHSKRWPIERFAQVGRKLAITGGEKIVIVGDKQEEELGKTMEKLMQIPVLNLTAKLSLKQLAALFKRCSLLISTDSGPVHIAAAVGLRCVVIFGRNLAGLSPRRWGPRLKNSVVLHNPPNCYPCLAHNCQNNLECLQRITVEDVLKAVEKTFYVKGKVIKEQ